MIRKAAFLLSGNGLDSLILFVRNLVVARLLSIEDYGIATTFALTATLVEMASQMGLKQLIVQAPEGEDADFQTGLQGFQLLRGAIGAAALLLLAEPIARFLGVPDLAPAYRVVALVPLLQGFLHFDLHRLERRSEYRPLIFAFAGSSLLSLLALWPLDMLFGDWRIMLGAILVQHGAQVGMSHLFAHRRYALRLDRELMRRSIVFGWPLLLNGLLLFVVFHGEKLIAGRELGLAALGILSMGVTLTLTPGLVAGRSIQSLLLPRLSRADGKRFAALAGTACDAGAVAGLAIVIGYALLGPLFVHLVLGEKFADLIPLLVPLAVLQAVRFLKTGPSIVALSRARTGLPMLAQLPRVASIGLSWLVLARGGDLLDLVLIALAGEAAGTALAFLLMRRVPDAPRNWLLGRGALPWMLALLALVLDMASRGRGGPVASWVTGDAATVMLWIVLAAMAAWSAYALRLALGAHRAM